MKRHLTLWLSLLLVYGFAGAEHAVAGAAAAPAKSIKYPERLHARRLQLIFEGLRVAKKHHSLAYKFGGSSPQEGGFDCSGAMYYVMRRVGLEPPRSSAAQYLWLRDAGRLHKVDKRVKSLDDEAFKDLRPGDLLFWSGTYIPADGRDVKITHVAMYLGKEEDGRRVMLSASEGRSYRGKKGNGYGVFDFSLPSGRSSAKFVGYGTPVGIYSPGDAGK